MFFVLVSSALLQALLPPIVFLGQGKFPFVLGVVVYYALNRETHVMLAAGFFGGFLIDVLSPVPPGYSAFCLCVIGLIAGRFRKLVLTETILTPIIFGAIAGAVAGILLYIMLVREGLAAWPFFRLVTRIIGAAILGAFCTPIMFAVAGTLDRLGGNVEAKESLDEVE